MKLFCVLSSIAIASSGFAAIDLLENQNLLVPGVLTERREPASGYQKTPYFKVGAGIPYATFSYGQRFVDHDLGKGYDHSLNILAVPSGIPFFVGYRYTRLKYSGTDPRKFSGVGFEVIIPAHISSSAPYIYTVPNIPLIFGRDSGDNEGIKWMQLEVNPLPIGIGLLVLSAGVTESINHVLFALCVIPAVNISWAF